MEHAGIGYSISIKSCDNDKWQHLSSARCINSEPVFIMFQHVHYGYP